MSKAWNQTRVARALGVDYPIIQGPLGGFLIATAYGGGIELRRSGLLWRHSLEPSAIKDVIAEIRSLTSKPFAMNLWVSMEDEGAAASDAADFEHAVSHLAPRIEAVGGTLPSFTGI